MKKLMTLALGLAFVLGTTSMFAQDSPKQETGKKKGGKKGGKKKSEAPKKGSR
jgi:hypothetical protein